MIFDRYQPGITKQLIANDFFGLDPGIQVEWVESLVRNQQQIIQIKRKIIIKNFKTKKKKKLNSCVTEVKQEPKTSASCIRSRIIASIWLILLIHAWGPAPSCTDLYVLVAENLRPENPVSPFSFSKVQANICGIYTCSFLLSTNKRVDRFLNTFKVRKRNIKHWRGK